MVTAGVSVVTAVGVSVVAEVVGLDVPVALAPAPPVLAMVPLEGPRTITASARQTLPWSLLLLPLMPLLVVFLWLRPRPVLTPRREKMFE